MQSGVDTDSRNPAAFYLFSFASGALALLYEVLWMRRFAALFGASTPAAAAVLSAFFLGLAVGSAVLGRRTERWSRPLRAYGLLECGIAAAALLVEPVLWLYERLYPSMYALLSGHPALFLAGKIGLAMAAIFLPTFLMGGALPALAQAYIAGRGRLGVRGGGLYAANTLGAAIGALSVPFAILPILGADRGFLAAMGANLLLGAAAWFLDPGSVRRNLRKETKSGRAPVGGASAQLARTLGILAFLSGFLQLALEVLWTRMFALVHENSVYSFSLVLAIFLLGLTGGAALAREFLRRGHSPGTGLTGAWFASGLWVLLSPRLFCRLTSGMDYSVVSTSVASHGFHLLLLSVPIMLPATLLSGAVLPLLMELAGGERGTDAGPALGRLLAINTLGAILGPLAANFVLSSNLGLWWSVALVGCAMLIATEIARLTASGRAATLPRRLAAYALTGLLVGVLSPGGLPRVPVVAGASLVSLEEGTYGTVAVMEGGGNRWMMINNYYVLGGTFSARNEAWQAHLPLLLHPAPDRVAFLGLGTGTTAGAALLHPVKSAVVLEIVPEVVRAARDHFADANRRVAEDPRVELLTEDARNFLKGSRRKFDVIVGDLVVPWRPGESSLFTLEHFRATREALLPGGIFCQWLALSQFAEEGFRIAVATFLQAYPKGMLWRGDLFGQQPFVALIGQKDPTPLDIAAIDRRVQSLAARVDDGNPILAVPAGFWLHLVGMLDPLDPRYADAEPSRDGRPWLELRTSAVHLSGSVVTDAKLHGRFLVALYEELRDHPLRGSPLNRLDTEHLSWREAGALLWEASILSAEGRVTEAHARGRKALAALPAPLQAAISESMTPGPTAPAP